MKITVLKMEFENSETGSNFSVKVEFKEEVIQSEYNGSYTLSEINTEIKKDKIDILDHTGKVSDDEINGSYTLSEINADIKKDQGDNIVLTGIVSDEYEKAMKPHYVDIGNNSVETGSVKCGKAFKQKPHLKKHMLTHTDEKYFKCEQCEKSFSQNVHLTRHIMTHTGEKSNECHQCHKNFSKKSHLTRHMMIHTGEKPYKCAQCEKSFIQKVQLSKHMLTHTGEKSYVKESEINGSYTLNEIDAGIMKDHSDIIVHTGIVSEDEDKKAMKPHHIDMENKSIETGSNKLCKFYKCAQGEKHFKQNAHLTRQMMTHNDDRPYKCVQCEKSFKRKDHLTKHMLTHTGSKPYKCVQCEKSFTRKDNLTNHMMTHTGKKAYICGKCHKVFSKETHLTNHMMTHTIWSDYGLSSIADLNHKEVIIQNEEVIIQQRLSYDLAT